MNSEELEVSLRTEFENYLKDVFAEVRQELSQLQEKFDAELDRHKSQLNDVFTGALSRFESERELDAGFTDTVTEHLRLSKDEGARITAMAIAQAEDMEQEAADAAAAVAVEVAPSAGVKEVFEAVSDISSKQSQAEILKSLVQHSSQFAPRGAFFIIKNDHLVGWRVFGSENPSSDEKVREVFLPVSADSILSSAVKSLEPARGATSDYADDAEIFNRLEFGESSEAVAIPLVARGRGVAVLYADGAESGKVDAEALETLIRVAGLTVEVLASSKGSSVKKETAQKAAPAEEYSAPVNAYEAAPQEQESVTPVQEETQNSYQPSYADSNYAASSYQSEAPVAEEVSSNDSYQPAESYQSDNSYQPTDTYQSDNSYQPTDTYQPTDNYHVEEVSPVEEPTTSYEPTYQEQPSYQTSYQEEAVPTYTQPETFQPEEPAQEYNQPEAAQTVTAEEVSNANNFSAQEYAQNFAKETDPAEYAKDFSYQPEPAQTEEPRGFDYQPTVETSEPTVEPSNTYEYETHVAQPAEPFNAPQVETAAAAPEEFTPTKEQTYGSFEPQPEKQEPSFPQSFEPVSQPVQAAAPKSRLSERNVDLPIEVSEDERRLHNDARRFARLLVSEIKLYNEQKVKEGRDSGDLYERLREAIDRSREMYDKRVQPPVAAKFDYFHYELVNTLAEGDNNKLGVGYPGATV